MLVPAEVLTVARAEEGSAVLIRPVGSDIAVPIIIGQSEAQSIMIGLANHTTSRPLTHDLVLAILKSISISINRIEITDLKDNTFFARLILRDNKNLIEHQGEVFYGWTQHTHFHDRSSAGRYRSSRAPGDNT